MTRDPEDIKKRHPLRRKEDFFPVETLTAVESVKRIMGSDNEQIKSALTQCLAIFELASQAQTRENLLHVEIAALRHSATPSSIDS